MRLLIVLFALLGMSFQAKAQTLKGKIYDTNSTVKNIKIFNTTQKRFTVSNEDGDFNIEAKVNDTIAFESLFYDPKKSHFERHTF